MALFLAFALCLTLLPAAVLSILQSMSDGGTQYIYCDGVISGHFKGSVEDCGDAKTYYFSNLTESSMYLGVNPPWDTNPFFFYLKHDGRSWRTSNGTVRNRVALGRRDTCYNAYGDCTYDAVYNLAVASTYYVCFKDGAQCSILEYWPWYYVTAQMYNLSAASVTRAQGDDPTFGSDTYYVVSGDYHTWVSNGTVQWNGASVQLPHNYSSSEEDSGDCGNTYHVYWYAAIS
jgi:hypothetical protein